MNESAKRECMEEAEICASLIVDNLSVRKGFGEWWHELDSEIHDEILEEIKNVVYDHIICSDKD